MQKQGKSKAKAMQKQCKSKAKAMQKQCKSNAKAMQKQCRSKAKARQKARQKQCKSKAKAMQKQGKARQKQGFCLALPCFCLAFALLLPCFCLASALLLHCFCLAFGFDVVVRHEVAFATVFNVRADRQEVVVGCAKREPQHWHGHAGLVVHQGLARDLRPGQQLLAEEAAAGAVRCISPHKSPG